MCRLPSSPASKRITYPISDANPMAETDLHLRLMTELFGASQGFYAAEPLVYVSGRPRRGGTSQVARAIRAE